MAISVVVGVVFSALVISPIAMMIADWTHHIHGSEQLGFGQSIRLSLKEAYGPGFFIWKIAHALVGAFFGLLMGIVLAALLKSVRNYDRLQNEFIRNEMTLEIGKLVRGIVHNINNYLTVLQGNADLLKMDFPDNNRVSEIINASKSLREMTQNILVHTKIQKGSVREIDLNEILKKNLDFLAGNSFFKRQITVRTELDPALPKIQGYESDFLQATYNLMDNAVDAMSKSTRKELVLITSCENGKIHLEIIDSGEGIPTEIQSKLFTPGFTTKPFEAKEGEPTGTGFGLANVRDMLKPYGVEMGIRTKPGETCFSLNIPVQNKMTTKPGMSQMPLKQAA